MSRQIQIAVTQMEPGPAPLAERLERAGRLVSGAAQKGAALVVLPELFNSGYIYDVRNYAVAEALEGPTVAWMGRTAAEHNLHLAGTLLLREGEEIYNALLLVAPQGDYWRYDKCYPWAWERAYFRPGRGITVAETALGRVGMLICWDAAHLELWKAYAGQVDLMVISSCAPDVSKAVYSLPGGVGLKNEGISRRMQATSDTLEKVFQQMLSEQTAWLGVPAVNAMGVGMFHSPIPRGRAAALSMLSANPGLLRYLGKADEVQMHCGMFAAAKVADAQGETLVALSEQAGETFALARVTLPDAPPQPVAPQPPTRLHPFAYSLSDGLLPRLMLPLYRKGKKG